jgi:hypothetical protein
MTVERRAIHVNVSEDAYNCWRAIADDNGVSLSALLEVLAGGVKGFSSSDLEKLVDDSRRVDASRRRRRRRESYN